MTGQELKFDLHFQFQVGEYVEAHEDPNITNTNWSLAYPEIYLDPIGNLQYMLNIFELKMGIVKKPRSVAIFPMPDCVINLVNAL